MHGAAKVGRGATQVEDANVFDLAPVLAAAGGAEADVAKDIAWQRQDGVQQVKVVNESVFNLAPDLGAEADRAESKARHGGGNEASLLWVRQY